MSDMPFEEDGDLVAQMLAAEEEIRSTPKVDKGDKPKKPRKRKAEPTPVPEDDEAYKQRVGMTATALTATVGGLVDAYELEPEFTEAHGQVLAEAWVPVLDYYAGESENPLWPALITTLVVMFPYMYQLSTRPRGEDVTDLTPHAPGNVQP